MTLPPDDESIARDLATAGYDPEAMANVVNMLIGSNQPARAGALLVRTAKQVPAHPYAADWLMQAAGVAVSLSDLPAAAAALRGVAVLAPQHGGTYSNLSDVLRHDSAALALTMARRALAIEPLSAPALGNVALARQVLQQHDRVELDLRRAAAVAPAHQPTLVNLSHIILLDARAEEAERWIRRALSVDSSNPHLTLNLAYSQLAQGKIEAGYPLAENRLLEPGLPPRPTLRIVRPRWEGEPLDGRSLFIWMEQGIGDHLYFARWLPMVSGNGNVIVESDPRLVPLYRRSFPRFDIVAARPSVEETLSGRTVDLQIPISSLPLPFMPAIRREIEALRAGRPGPVSRYLVPDPIKVAHWEPLLSSRPNRLRIAVSWRGGNMNATNMPHYMSATDLAAIFRGLPVTIVNVQYSWTEDEIAYLRRELPAFIHPPIDLKNDLEDVAAILAGCDVLVTAHTAVMYLAAGAGLPVWSFLAGQSWATHGLGPAVPLFPNVRTHPRRVATRWSTITEQIRRLLVDVLEGRSPKVPHLPARRG